MQAVVRQRRELTFKHNAGQGRHGWLRLTPAYSVRVVEDILAEERGAERVLDPFCGTGTTALAAASRGLRALSTDINPFLIWVSTLKTRSFAGRELAAARAALARCLRELPSTEPAAPPAIHNIERWWAPNRLRFLCRLRAAIRATTRAATPARDLLMVGFCRTMIGLSNAAFNHQSMSFKVGKGAAARADDVGAREDGALVAAFCADAELVLASAAENPRQAARILRADSRTLDGVARGSFDLLVTSPPYPNRMSYIRELRPYMYWTDFLSDAQQAGELDWQAIGGTWGTATSRLMDWHAEGETRKPRLLRGALASIRQTRGANAELLARYVDKYFQDMSAHLAAVSARIARGGRVHYVIGNSTFYGVLVPAERILAELLAEHGFEKAAVRVLRKRNSKRELFEFDVVATKS